MKTNYRTSTDEQFVTRDGRTVRYQELFEGIDRGVRSVARGLSRQDREDLFQDAAFGVVRSRSGFDPGRGNSCPQAYGAMVARNCAKDAFAKAARRNATLVTPVSRDEDENACDPVSIESYAGDGYEADRQLGSSEAEAYIEEKILSLSERYRTVIGLQRQGLKPRQMAVILDCTPQNASLTLHRAHKALKRALGPEFLADHGICA